MLEFRQEATMNLGFLVSSFRSTRGLTQKIMSTLVRSMIHEVIIKTRRHANNRVKICGLLLYACHVWTNHK